MYFQFYLDDLEVEEPVGFSDIMFKISRDNNWHGVFFEASASDLTFYGPAAEYLINKKETQGLRSSVVFRALQSCGIYEEPEEILTGNLDFRKFSKSCGNECTVTMPVEQTGCIMTMRNRYDQKVDMDSSLAFNKQTAIQQYDKMNFEMELPGVELKTAVDGSVSEEQDIITFDITSSSTGYTIFVRPTYAIERDSSIQTSQLTPTSSWETNGISPLDSAISPQLLFEDNISCFNGSFEYSIRKKGSFDVTDGDGNIVQIKLKLITWDGTGTIFNDHVTIDETTLYSGAGIKSGNFDGTISGTTTLADGIGLYAIIEFSVLSAALVNSDYSVTFDEDTYFTLTAPKLCPATDANVYAINESLSHVAEAITDGCLRVKSDYYGRSDSQPYTSSEDGCGSLRVLTSGLQIRRAETPKFFASLKDLFEGLRGIDNIGMGIETNPFLPNAEWLRIEPVEYFYQDKEILSFPLVPEAKTDIQEQLHWSLVKTGFKKWEVEDINGLDEPNSNKEYRTGLSSVNNTLDIQSGFVAGSYPIEITRQQSFAETGAADTKYDNDTFIICVERNAYGFIVEQNNIDNAANMFSPSTLYNWRIRPYYNLMRWFKSIANSYPNISDTSNKLFFSSGTGNLIAEGQIGGAYPECKLENGVKAENRDLGVNDFADTSEATPLWKPEYMTFRYPLSVKDYRTIKENPYGYISIQCGTGEFVKGYIQSVNYRLNKGEADFVFKLKWE